MRNILLVFIVLILGVLLVVFNPLTLKQQAGLQVTTDGVITSLFLDGEYLDKTPFIDKKIQPGEYVLRLQPDDAGLAAYELPITLNKGMVTVINWKPGVTLATSGGVVYEMEKLQRGSDIQLNFQTVPDGAILSFDGGSKQFSPLLLTDLGEGSHQFEVSLPSYETQRHAINLIKGHKVTVTAIMAKTGEQPIDTTQNTGLENSDNQASEAAVLDTGATQVQILSTNYFVNNQEVLRVRDAASAAGAELGFAVVGENYPYLSEETEWFEIEFEGQSGWVSRQFSQKITVR